MAMPKKGSRRIEVDQVTYRWRVSQWRRISGWKPSDLETVDAAWLEQARKFGLGDTANVVFNIPIELHDGQGAQLLVKYYAQVVDGFLGIEQITQIKPSFVRQIIENARASGWNLAGEQSLIAEIVENSGEPHRPALLLLPGRLATQPVPGYAPVARVTQVWPARDASSVK